MNTDARGRCYVEQRTDVETPGVSVERGHVLALGSRRYGDRSTERGRDRRTGSRVVRGGRQVDFAVLVAHAEPEAGVLAQLVGNGGIDVVRLDLGFDALEAAEPG